MAQGSGSQTAAGTTPALVHPALTSAVGVVERPLADAATRLSDRERLAVLLQGAALLAHLRHAGWRLATGWEGASLTGDGLLRVAGCAPGAFGELPQEPLRALADRLFGGAGDGRIAGRGSARRVARSLLAGWAQSLVAVPADEAVAQVVEAAPFLWDEAFASARTALGAEHRLNGSAYLWVAGPGRWRRRVLGAAAHLAGLHRLLAGPEAAELWRGGDGDPRELAAAGRWRRAVEAWAGSPPATAGERLELARCHLALGRFAAALETIRGRRGVEVALLRARCQLHLGRLGAARRALDRLAAGDLAPTATVEAAAVAVRVAANRGHHDAARDWLARALAAARGRGERLLPRARLVAALAAWDRGDGAAMERHLEASRELLREPDHAWHWRQARGLAALAGGDPGAAAKHFATALAGSRRRLYRHRAAALWNDLGVARGQAGDLAGAERAFLHSLRLYRGCDGPREATLGLVNLAEIRLRRGRPRAVREILERSGAENRAAGNLRGDTYDSALWARVELLHGRPESALGLCREALARLERAGLAAHRDELRVLSARALGWLGRTAEAAVELELAGTGALRLLEPEERPAVCALAGEREAAMRHAEGVPGGVLWRRLLVAEAPPPEAWAELAALEPYRAARAVFDLDLLFPGSVPTAPLRRAVATLRRLGAGLPAQRLEARDSGPWGALAEYLVADAADPGGAGPGPLEALFAAAGYPEARLIWAGADDSRVLVAGPGGEERLVAPAAGGELELRAPRLDPVLEVLFRLACRDAVPPPRPRRPPASGGIVGRSPELLAALGRVELLAPGELPILVRGESGTGKELVARRVHRLSRRREGPFVAVNCAALSESLLLSDLFGHVRGAFTGADRDRAGVFETAQGGTVFLDEIGDLPGHAQGMLLRVLQEGEVRRVGETLPRRVDVRVVAATHRDLVARAAEGGFRDDLYYRLRGAVVTLPPLRDRGGDVLLLAEHLLARSAARSAAGAAPPRLTPAARERLLAHRWPGNVRELDNVLAAAAALADGGDVEPRHLELPEAGPLPGSDYHRRVETLRRRLVEEALEACGGHQAEAARRLGLSRQALSYLVRSLGLV